MVVDFRAQISQNSPVSAVDARAAELDTIAAVLPIERRDELAELLTDQDGATLRHLVNEGMGQNILGALASDLACLQSWAMAATGAPLPWPAPVALLLNFVAHHLWDPEKRISDPEQGTPETVAATLRSQGLLRSLGPKTPRVRIALKTSKSPYRSKSRPPPATGMSLHTA